jgi:Transcription factor WhiB
MNALATYLDAEGFFPAWQRRSACRRADPTLFERRTRQGALLCAGCPVRQECAAYALEHCDPKDTTIWAALSLKQRERLQQAGWKLGDPLPPIRIPRAQPTSQPADDKVAAPEPLARMIARDAYTLATTISVTAACRRHKLTTNQFYALLDRFGLSLPDQHAQLVSA